MFQAWIADGVLRIQGDADTLLGMIHLLESGIVTGFAAVVNSENQPLAVVERKDPEEPCLN